MNNNSAPSIQLKMYNAGMMFLSAAKRCNEKRGRQNNQFDWLPVPAIVNAAFAIELFLKSILTVENRQIQKLHKIIDLYKEITHESQAVIEQNMQMSNDQFNDKLKEISDVFVEWRYYYEKDYLRIKDLPFLMNLASKLEERSRQLSGSK